jgi:hypothetical protein
MITLSPLSIRGQKKIQIFEKNIETFKNPVVRFLMNERGKKYETHNISWWEGGAPFSAN